MAAITHNPSIEKAEVARSWALAGQTASQECGI